MKLTAEQQAIIEAEGSIKVNAVAGSGKTTTIIAYAKARPKAKRMLYLAFNKSVQDEAQRKFDQAGLQNVTVRTAHSLAYESIIRGSNYQLLQRKEYDAYEVVRILGLKSVGSEKHSEYILANHILKFVAYFCNSDAQKVQELNYLDCISEGKARDFVEQHYDEIEYQTRVFLGKMNKAYIQVTHDFYLKLFQLSNPKLAYDYVLFDEGQDASATMLDIFCKQNAHKIIVGDTHQQIYGWRYAVNSLEKTDFDTYHLSHSFRFGTEIAALAKEVLNLKKLVYTHANPVMIYGENLSKQDNSKAILARTNLGLLLKATEHITGEYGNESLYFEGNIQSYTYAEDGTSLYDVLHLKNLNHADIKHKMIRSMRDIDELKEYVDKTGDVQLSIMLEIVNKYGKDIFGIMKNLKAKHTQHRADATWIFSTVHKSKGLEYDEVTLTKDFVKEDQLNQVQMMEMLASLGGATGYEPPNKAKLIEEINLLYVAVTRAKQTLYLPENLVPKSFTPQERVKTIK